jgi:hypothetical protein
MTPESGIVIYEGGEARVEVRVERESVWLSLQQLAELFGRDKSVISRHLKAIFASGELERDSGVAKNATTAADGKTYWVDYYNLDAIISVGYRVNSSRATRFRQWATRVLREHLTQGYSLDRQRFEKNAAELEAALQLVRKAAGVEALASDQGRGLVDVIARYTQTFLWLQRYDAGLLTEPKGSPGGALPGAQEARAARRAISSAASGRKAWPRCSATWIRPFWASRRTRRSNRRPRTCCTSSSRTTRSPTATSALVRSCSWIS